MGSKRHLSKGDDEPSLNDSNKLQLLSMRFCPYAQRIHLVLDTKQIPYDTTNIDLKNKPEWLPKYSPFGKVPALGLTNEPNTPWIHESLIIADYLDEKYPEIPLYPQNPLKKAQDRLWIEKFDTILTNFHKIVIDGFENAVGSLTAIAECFDKFEKELNDRATLFFGGSKPGMVDLMIWPWCERFGVLKFILADKYELDKERYPKMIQWHKNMLNDEAVQCSFVNAENHVKYLQSRKAGAPDYDMLLNPAKRQRTI